MAGLPPLPTSSSWANATGAPAPVPAPVPTATQAPAPAQGDANAVAAQLSTLNVSEQQVPTDTAGGSSAPSTSQASSSSEADGALAELARYGLNNLVEDHQIEVQIEQADPNSPLYSITEFAQLGLTPELLQGVFDMNYKKPSRIQEKALPLIFKFTPQGGRENLIAQSQSGTGKTAAFVLGMLGNTDPSQGCQAICLAPSRELAKQTALVCRLMSKHTAIRVAECVPSVDAGGSSSSRGARGGGSSSRGGRGGSGAKKGANASDDEIRGAHVIVGTPGTVLQCIERRVIDVRGVKMFVLDEADEMIHAQGLGDQCLRCKGMLPKNAQVLVFSDAFVDAVMDLAPNLMGDTAFNTIKLEVSFKAIKQFWINCGNEQNKYTVLTDIFPALNVGQVIVFCEMKSTCDDLKVRLTRDGIVSLALHGDLTGGERDETIAKFRNGEIKVLITTSVMARGIDVLTVNLVVNYDMPVTRDNQPDFKSYYHRIGRTGRFGRKGCAINLIHDQVSYNVLMTIQQQFGYTIVPISLDEIDGMADKLKAHAAETPAPASIAVPASDMIRHEGDYRPYSSQQRNQVADVKPQAEKPPLVVSPPVIISSDVPTSSSEKSTNSPPSSSPVTSTETDLKSMLAQKDAQLSAVLGCLNSLVVAAKCGLTPLASDAPPHELAAAAQGIEEALGRTLLSRKTGVSNGKEELMMADQNIGGFTPNLSAKDASTSYNMLVEELNGLYSAVEGLHASIDFSALKIVSQVKGPGINKTTCYQAIADIQLAIGELQKTDNKNVPSDPNGPSRCSALELARAIHKDAMSQYCSHMTLLIKDALTTVYGDKWHDEVKKAFGRESKTKVDDNVWDVLDVCAVLKTPRLLSIFVNYIRGSDSSESSKMSLRDQVELVGETISMVRNFLEHETPLSLACLRLTCDRMNELVCEVTSNSAPEGLTAPTHAIRSLAEIPNGCTSSKVVPVEHLGYILASRALLDLKDAMKELALSTKATKVDLTNFDSLCLAVKGNASAKHARLARNQLAHKSLSAKLIEDVLAEIDSGMKAIKRSTTYKVMWDILRNSGTSVRMVVERSDSDEDGARQLPFPRVRKQVVGRAEAVLRLSNILAVQGARLGLYGGMGVGKTVLAKQLLLHFENEGRVHTRFKAFPVMCGQTEALYRRDWLAFARFLADQGKIDIDFKTHEMSDEDVVLAVTPIMTAFLSDPARGCQDYLILVDDMTEEVESLVRETLPVSSLCGLVATAKTAEPLRGAGFICEAVPSLTLGDCLELVYSVDDEYRNVDGLTRLILEDLACHTLSVCVLAGLLRNKPKEKSCLEHFASVVGSFHAALDPAIEATKDHRGLGAFVDVALEHLRDEYTRGVTEDVLGRLMIVAGGGLELPACIAANDKVIASAKALGLVEDDPFDNALILMHKLTHACLEKRLKDSQAFRQPSLWEGLASGFRSVLCKYEDKRADSPTDELYAKTLRCLDRLLADNRYDNVAHVEPAKGGLDPTLKDEFGEVLREAAEVARFSSKYDAALRYSEESLKLIIKASLSHARALMTWASIRAVLGGVQKSEARKKVNTALGTFQQARDLQGQAACYRFLGNDDNYNDRGGKAIDNYNNCLQILFEIHGESPHEDIANCLMELGVAERDLGRDKDALDHFEQARTMWIDITGIETHAEVAACYSHMGAVHTHHSRHSDAFVAHTSALAIFKHADFHGLTGRDKEKAVASCHTDLGHNANSLSKFEHCIAHHREALEFLKRTYRSGHHVTIATCHEHIGTGYKRLNQYNEAFQHFEAARDIFRKKSQKADATRVESSMRRMEHQLENARGGSSD